VHNNFSNALNYCTVTSLTIIILHPKNQSIVQIVNKDLGTFHQHEIIIAMPSLTTLHSSIYL